MDNWKKVNEISLPGKEGFYNHLGMKNIIYPDYTHRKRVCKVFKIKKLGEFHYLYVESDTLLLSDVYEKT